MAPTSVADSQNSNTTRLNITIFDADADNIPSQDTRFSRNALEGGFTAIGIFGLVALIIGIYLLIEWLKNRRTWPMGARKGDDVMGSEVEVGVATAVEMEVLRPETVIIREGSEHIGRAC
ncbi:hypothetical protein G7Y89_g12962 [Cudoniella acicularis]|uniref:Uncharacterized protein n=1 Tax=Cudoniella acicularis TaxID=354080 RepID=A0A8H4RBL9_9HELO|nr:hypothetical protein G7Y89_g12962 [Cudoniella acicularis]